MKLKILSSIGLFLLCGHFFAQQKFYATTDAKNAQELKTIFPQEVEIIGIENQQAAVYLTENAAHYLHKNVLTHGPGYVYKSSKEEAQNAISKVQKSHKILDFSITMDAMVNTAISQVNAENIKNHIQILQNYGTRRHTTPQAQTAVQDLKAKWENLIAASGRTDVSVRIVDHTGTPMPSLVLTINGNSAANEYVIVGAHMDSISGSSQAPGADDDTSGIATISEMIRILLDMNYKPEKTVEFMAFAAEEIGLVGSSEIAADYAAENKDVVSFVQFDMTNYKGSSKDIYLTTDSYNSNDLNLFLIELMEHYNASGTHAFTYGNTICNYGCSDHFSWAENGYNSAFPFESSFSSHNPYIHTSDDTLANSGNSANHAAKFAKLGLEFIIETAKSEMLSTQDFSKNNFVVYVKNKALYYQYSSAIQHIQIVDTAGRNLLEKRNLLSSGTIDLNSFQKGFYLAVFKDKNGKVLTKKFILE